MLKCQSGIFLILLSPIFEKHKIKKYLHEMIKTKKNNVNTPFTIFRVLLGFLNLFCWKYDIMHDCFVSILKLNFAVFTLTVKLKFIEKYYSVQNLLLTFINHVLFFSSATKICNNLKKAVYWVAFLSMWNKFYHKMTLERNTFLSNALFLLVYIMFQKTKLHLAKKLYFE